MENPPDTPPQVAPRGSQTADGAPAARAPEGALPAHGGRADPDHQARDGDRQDGNRQGGDRQDRAGQDRAGQDGAGRNAAAPPPGAAGGAARDHAPRGPADRPTDRPADCGPADRTAPGPDGTGRDAPGAGTGRDHTALPAHVAGSGTLDRLVETARGYARTATAEATQRAYATDWAQFTAWCRARGASPLPPAPEMVGLYLADMASGTTAPVGHPPGRRPGHMLRGRAPARSVATLERRLAGLVWGYRQRGLTLDRQDRHIAGVLAGIRRRHARPPRRKAALLADDILAMAATLPHDLRGLRDRAILLLGYAGGLRRSEITGLDAERETSPDGTGWVEILAPGALLTLRGKTGWREVAVGRGSSERSCPVQALERWMQFAGIDHGPLFRRVARDGARALPHRLTDRHVARLVKRTVLAAGLRPDLPEAERLALFSGHSLRAGLATAAEVEERHVQAHLGHASAEMTRRYQRRRDRFRINLTKAAGL